MHLNLGLIVGSGREHLALAHRDSGVSVNKLGHHAAQGLDTHRQGNDIEQDNTLIVQLTADDTALNSSAHSDHLVGVHTLRRSLAEETLDNLLDGGDTGATAHQNHLVDVAGAHVGVAQSLLARADSGLNQVVTELLKHGAAQGLDQVLGHAVLLGNVGQVDLGAGRARQLNLSLLGSLLQALECHRVTTQVDTLLLLELVG